MTQSRRPAFVLGLDANGYGTVRSLVHEGVEVVAFYKELREFGRLSRYCEAHRVDPAGEEEFSKSLIELSQSFDAKPVLLATSDHYVNFLTRNCEVLAEHFLFHWVTPEILAQVVRKGGMESVCRDLGLAHPETHLTQPDEDISQSASEFILPVIVKPIQSFGVEMVEKNYVFDSVSALVDFYSSYPDLRGATVWQEIIGGEDDQIFQYTVLVRRSGEIGPHVSVRKIRQYVPGFGTMCFGRSEQNETIARESIKLLHAIDYRGFASIEFKYCREEDRFYFIEMNPRLPWYNKLFEDVGVNLPHLGYLDLVLGDGDEVSYSEAEQEDGTYWINLRADLAGLARRTGEDALSPSQWLRSASQARSFAWLEWRDLVPVLRTWLEFLRAIYKRWLGSPRHLPKTRLPKARRATSASSAAETQNEMTSP